MPSCSSLICSDHFEENSYSTCRFTKRRLLKQEAVPIIFSKTPKQTPKVGLPSSTTDGNNMQPDGTTHGMHSVSSQTETFTDVSDRMNKLKDELKELQDSLGKRAFIPENISNDTQMKALTGFTKERFSCVYSFLNVEEDLQTGNFWAHLLQVSKGVPIPRYPEIWSLFQSLLLYTFCFLLSSFPRRQAREIFMRSFCLLLACHGQTKTPRVGLAWRPLKPGNGELGGLRGFPLGTCGHGGSRSGVFLSNPFN
ncbi:hypothetical protein AVEN_143723-1 [Araneus ventricosus]|uniref:THAP-type domain-containing protein n=1 Tax=Araneus ventricosus TaxID=182803 RepID=A0A4Y2ANU6_ARAVE|nr:hypothetical protein AVEN_143723-1 [Araneus ventricosus]